MNSTDHDLLIRVDTKLGTLIQEVQLMRDTTNQRLTNVENNKVDVSEFHEFKAEIVAQVLKLDTDFKKTLLERDKINMDANKELSDKIDKLKTILYIGVGIVATLQFVIPIVIANILK